jgi:hypothetical protein
VFGTDRAQVGQRRTFCGHSLTTNVASFIRLDFKVNRSIKEAPLILDTVTRI